MKILIACGGTGGHIFPGLSLAKELDGREGVDDLILVGSNHPLEKKIFSKTGLHYELIAAAKFSRGPFKFLLFLAKFALACAKSIYLLLRFNPDIVVGFGGYASFPVCFFAPIMGKKLFLHEQNRVAGLANRILSVMARGVAVSFRDTQTVFKNKGVFTGNPIRKSILFFKKEESLKSLGLNSGKFTILVMGGSQGSLGINNVVAEFLRLLPDSDKMAFQIIHIAGNRDFENISAKYKDSLIDSKVFGFVDEIGPAYAAADLIVSRAGATALFEIAALGIPSIMIPYRYAGGHQYYNAEALEKAGGAAILKEEALTAAALRDKISELRDDKARLKRMSECAKKFAVTDAAARLADYVMGGCSKTKN
ncbi:MAG: undecaprenyldiphospho-muramoylpentapeptide beta-N-acetylglucosaminyltransferase [Candidatus Omnitrophota bacterium]